MNVDQRHEVLCAISISVENRKILHEQEAEKMLIHLLNHESAEVQTSAAQALAIMAENLTSRDSIREWGKNAFACIVQSNSVVNIFCFSFKMMDRMLLGHLLISLKCFTS